MDDIFKRHIQQFQPPSFGSIVGEGIDILPNAENIFKQIGSDEATCPINENRAFELVYFILVNQNSLICHAVGV